MIKFKIIWVESMMIILLLSSVCTTDQSVWKRAHQIYSIEAMDDYLRRYPTGNHSDEAIKIKAKLQEQRDLQIASNMETNRWQRITLIPVQRI